MAENAAGAVVARIDRSELVQGVSCGAVVSGDLDDDRNVPPRAAGYGQALALLLLLERLGTDADG